MKKVGFVLNGEELIPGGVDFFEVINPASGKVIAQEVCCDAGLVDQIVNSSKQAFDSQAWQQLLPADRGNCLLNGYPQIPVPPHKMSGTGVELGMEGLLTYCKQKSVVMAYDDQKAVGWNL
jgi:acyl-CoA reductase-like NAD-dependent aldehyde dehydrogenase